MSLLAALGLSPRTGSRPASTGVGSAGSGVSLTRALRGGGHGGDESAYRANLQSIEADLRELLGDRPPDKASETIHGQLVLAHDLMVEAEADGDFEQAAEHLNELPALIEGYRKARDAARRKRAQEQAAAKAAYEAKLSPIRSRLSAALLDKPVDPGSKRIHGQLRDGHAAMIASAATGDYIAAGRSLATLVPLLDAYQAGIAAQAAAKLSYQAWFRRAEPAIRRVIENEMPQGAGPVKAHDKLVDASYAMEAAAAAGDFVSAEKLRPTITPLIEQYRKARQEHAREVVAQAAAQKVFQARIAALEAGLVKVAAKAPLEAVTQRLRHEIDMLDGQLQFARVQASWVAANGYADELEPLIAPYLAAWEKAAKDPKVGYDRLRASLESRLQGALMPPRKEKFMLDLQDQVKALKASAEKAAAGKKHEAAFKQLQALQSLLDKFAIEDRKTPHSCQWLNGVALALISDAGIKFNDAANKLDDLADAYDRALKAHKEALEAHKESSRLADFLLDLVFMVALPGVLGGAVAARLKKWLGPEAASAVASGAFVDGSKDVMKFVTRVSVEQLSVKPPEPIAVGVLEGSGVTLTRSISKQLRNEQTGVLKAVRTLALLLMEKADDCAKGKPIRIEGDPSKALADDPFFKVIDSMGKADQTGFATEIWRAWIKEYAYRLEERATLTARKRYRVEQAFDDDLIPAIEKQVSSGFNVKRALEDASDGMRQGLNAKGEIELEA